MTQHLNLELLVGRQTRDVDGKLAGRIMEVRGHRDGGDFVITTFELGAAALLDRLGIYARHLFGFGRHQPLLVPWQQMDLTDPDHPRLRVRREELQRA